MHTSETPYLFNAEEITARARGNTNHDQSTQPKVSDGNVCVLKLRILRPSRMLLLNSDLHFEATRTMYSKLFRGIKELQAVVICKQYNTMAPPSFLLVLFTLVMSALSVPVPNPQAISVGPVTGGELSTPSEGSTFNGFHVEVVNNKTTESTPEIQASNSASKRYILEEYSSKDKDF
ncbi:hypothetical protein K439DRAFT_708508 [Ramaria rubella]|nr:hypothetical protein K439DRAFT_708508 [Ramaria rubella]